MVQPIRWMNDNKRLLNLLIMAATLALNFWQGSNLSKMTLVGWYITMGKAQ